MAERFLGCIILWERLVQTSSKKMLNLENMKDIRELRLLLQ
jgi:hypothetical protein